MSGYNRGSVDRSVGQVAKKAVPKILRKLVSACESLPTLMDTLSTIDNLTFSATLRPEVVADPTSDHALLEATRTGDEDAFAELVSRYRNQITSYIYRMTNDYDGAVDLAQETFVRVYRAADRYQTTYAFSTYIYRIATNLAISELRKRKRRKLVSLTGFFQSKDGAEPQEFNPVDEKPLGRHRNGRRRTPPGSATGDQHAAGEVSSTADSARCGWEKLRRNLPDSGNERGDSEIPH